MASRSAVELDFFRMERDCSSKPLPNKLFDRRRSFRDIQSYVSKMNPQLLKTVIASGSVDQSTNLPKSSSFSVPVTPKHEENVFPAFPLYIPPFRSNTCGSDQSTPESGPLTIFYNGTVTVFDVPRHEAENILKIAKGGVSNTVESVNPELALSSTDQHQLLKTLKGDLRQTRTKSLQRFLEKRKERLTLELSPYGCPTRNTFSGKNTSRYED